MLYDRWCQIARSCGQETALIDLTSRKRWTFGQLAKLTDGTGEPDSGLVFPRGLSPEFIFSILRAWRTQAVVCPLEEGQQAVDFHELPRSCIHLKITSASTGVPRLVAFTAEQLLADVDQIVATMGLRRDW